MTMIKYLALCLAGVAANRPATPEISDEACALQKGVEKQVNKHVGKQCTQMADKQCWGHELEPWPPIFVSSAEKCADECAQKKGCHAYTFNKGTAGHQGDYQLSNGEKKYMCWLKDTCLDPRPDDKATSGTCGEAPEEPSKPNDWGQWRVVRKHEKWHNTAINVFCGRRNDQFEIQCRPQKSKKAHCKNKYNAGAHFLINQDQKQVAPGFFCCTPKHGNLLIIEELFTASEHCDPNAGEYGYWTVTRRDEETGKEQEDTFCGMKTDTFSIGKGPSQYCQRLSKVDPTQEDTENGWVIVDQDGNQAQWAWYCENQRKPVIKSSTFKADSACEPSD